MSFRQNIFFCCFSNEIIPFSHWTHACVNLPTTLRRKDASLRKAVAITYTLTDKMLCVKKGVRANDRFPCDLGEILLLSGHERKPLAFPSLLYVYCLRPSSLALHFRGSIICV